MYETIGMTVSFFNRDVIGKFTDVREHAPEALPGYPHRYAIRHGDDGEPATVEPYVFVNFFGYVYLKEPLTFPPGLCLDIKEFWYPDDASVYEEVSDERRSS
ncbi:MAG TPA: LPD28 domain-containing protein [Syntrophorhabdaceae bacterium]|nr:LPD28 domain-containing protein [Syntrophorhabdaceae bacterium]